YDGNLMVLHDLTVNKSGNRIQLVISNCSGKNFPTPSPSGDNVDFIKTPNGYSAVIFSEQNEQIVIHEFDGMGRRMFSKIISLHEGSNTLEIPSPGNGIYLVEISGENFSVV